MKSSTHTNKQATREYFGGMLNSRWVKDDSTLDVMG